MDVLGMEGQVLSGKGDDVSSLRAWGEGERITRSLSSRRCSSLAFRDDLGRHRRDPAQHHWRAGPRPTQGAKPQAV